MVFWSSTVSFLTLGTFVLNTVSWIVFKVPCAWKFASAWLLTVPPISEFSRLVVNLKVLTPVSNLGPFFFFGSGILKTIFKNPKLSLIYLFWCFAPASFPLTSASAPLVCPINFIPPRTLPRNSSSTMLTKLKVSMFSRVEEDEYVDGIVCSGL